MALVGIALGLLVSSCRTAAPAPRPGPAPSLLAKGAPEAVRVMTWNIGRDSIFPGSGHDRSERFARVLKAIDPDVVCLQEVWRGDASAAELFDSLLPLGEGRAWQHHGMLDNAILSRQPLTRRATGKLETRERRLRGHAMALSGEGTSTPLYLVCAHFETRAAAGFREKQANLIVSQLARDRPRGNPPRRTPILVLGDLNAVAGHSSRFLVNLREGRVAGRRSNLDIGFDWDGSDFRDALPRHNGRGDEVWTWRDDTGELPPAATDRILYSGSVARLVKAFVLDTTAMTAEELAAAGLERDDVLFDADRGVHDHLPVVADFLTGAAMPPPSSRGTLLFAHGFESGTPCIRWSEWVRAGCTW